MYKVIVAEDEKIIRNMLVEFINTNIEDFHVEESFSDGKEAIEYIKHNHIDVVITDICMIEVSGIELAKYIYDHELPIKVIIISGYRDFSYAQQAIKYNVSNYLTKPTSPLDLNSALIKIKNELNDEKLSDTSRPTVSHKEKNEEISVNDLIIEKACLYISENLSKDIAMIDVADYVHLSTSHFGKIFRKNIQMGFSNYLTKVRMDKAIELLKEGRHKVVDISKMVGYQNCNYFIKNFKDYTGYTPKKYLVHTEEENMD